jgi:hypothetical protein
LKKRTKKLLLLRFVNLRAGRSRLRVSERAKVFWLFFSNNNTFSSGARRFPL